MCLTNLSNYEIIGRYQFTMDILGVSVSVNGRLNRCMKLYFTPKAKLSTKYFLASSEFRCKYEFSRSSHIMVGAFIEILNRIQFN